MLYKVLAMKVVLLLRCSTTSFAALYVVGLDVKRDCIESAAVNVTAARAYRRRRLSDNTTILTCYNCRLPRECLPPTTCSYNTTRIDCHLRLNCADFDFGTF